MSFPLCKNHMLFIEALHAIDAAPVDIQMLDEFEGLEVPDKQVARCAAAENIVAVDMYAKGVESIGIDLS